jgi:uncharacterized protein YbjT (DUF2867 family)
MRSRVQPGTEIVQGDLLNPASLDRALQGVQTAYYLVHLMSGSKDFEKEDRQAATNFTQAARNAGVRRIIYLGGLGDDADPKLSPHLRSRHEVGQILRHSGVETIEFRASLVIGTGSLSFDLVKSFTDRLPVMLCSRWLTTPTQPIAVDDVRAYPLTATDLPPAESRIFEIGSPDVTTYGGMIREYARQKGLRRWLISVPVLTPYLSSLGLALVTPASFEVGRHLIEGLKNPTVVRDTKALEVFPIRPMGIREAIQKALGSTTARSLRSDVFLHEPGSARYCSFLKVLFQLQNRHFFRLGLHFHGHAMTTPALREILHVDEVVMAFGLRAVPAFDGAGDVEQRLSVPGRQRLSRGLFDVHAIGIATVMMHVVDQWDAGGLADRQQIGGRVGLVVILNGQPTSDP